MKSSRPHRTQGPVDLGARVVIEGTIDAIDPPSFERARAMLRRLLSTARGTPEKGSWP